MEALLEWLREGGRGRHLREILADDSSSSTANFVHDALQGGAFPSLTSVNANLEFDTQIDSLRGGFLGAMRELRLTVNCRPDFEALESQLAGLGVVRQLPALAKLELEVLAEADPLVQWPPFIPPSLRTLRIDMSHQPPVNRSLLRDLPGMLGVSGARLDCLEVVIPTVSQAGDGLVHVAQALRCCSTTLKGLLFRTWNDYYCISIDKEDEVDADQKPRLCVQWADVLSSVSSCRDLQMLVLPRLKLEPLFPRGTAFGRLTHLEMSGHNPEHPSDAGVMGLWELMA
jgi:hypothetical protein